MVKEKPSLETKRRINLKKISTKSELTKNILEWWNITSNWRQRNKIIPEDWKTGEIQNWIRTIGYWRCHRVSHTESKSSWGLERKRTWNFWQGTGWSRFNRKWKKHPRVTKDDHRALSARRFNKKHPCHHQHLTYIDIYKPSGLIC